jgi:hypothetical protein
MTLLTTPEAEQLVKQASSVARIPATAKGVQAAASVVATAASWALNADAGSAMPLQ